MMRRASEADAVGVALTCNGTAKQQQGADEEEEDEEVADEVGGLGSCTKCQSLHKWLCAERLIAISPWFSAVDHQPRTTPHKKTRPPRTSLSQGRVHVVVSVFAGIPRGHPLHA